MNLKKARSNISYTTNDEDKEFYDNKNKVNEILEQRYAEIQNLVIKTWK